MEKRFNILKSKWLFALAGFVLFYGLFIINADLADTRLEKEIWNLGHLFGFFVVWLFLMNLFSLFIPSSLKRIGLVLLVTLIASSLIEIVQHYIGREATLQDIGLDLVGTILAVIVIISLKKCFRGNLSALITFFFITTAVLVWPSAKIFIDEVNIVRQFPILSDFSTPYELSRWSSNNAVFYIEERGDNHILKVRFRRDARYSVLALNSFGSAWNKYNELVYRVNNPGSHSLNIYVRVHDREHKYSHFAYEDRFYRAIKLKPGRSEIKIKLLDIYKAPEGRKMDLTEIESIMLFTVNLEKDAELEITKVFLR